MFNRQALFCHKDHRTHGTPVNNFSPQNGSYNGYSGGILPLISHPQLPQDMNSNFQAILNRLEIMDKKLEKLDSIDRQVNSLSQKMSALDCRITFLETSVKECNGKLIEIEVSRSHDSQTCDEIQSKQVAIDKILKDQQVKNNKFSTDFVELQSENDRLSEEVIDLQARSMRDNLLFFNFDEEISIDDRKVEDCKSKIVNFCKEELDIENVKLDRAHRVGRYIHGKKRPIVAKFHDPPIKESVKKSVFERKDTISKSVNDQYPKIVQDRRKQLIPWMLKARQVKKRAVLDRDRLYIENRMYTVNSLPIRELEHVILPVSESVNHSVNIESSG
jgi:hypothetical protein